MGNREVMIVLLIMVTFLYSGGDASIGPFRLTTLPLTVHLEDKNLEPKSQLEHLGDDGNGETSIPHHQRKVEGAIGGHGAVNGGQPGNGGGGSNSPYAQGGGAVVAGGGSNIRHNNHHSAASCIQRRCRNTQVLLAAILLVYLL